MRGTVAELNTAIPLAGLLPSMLRADEFAAQLCEGLDAVLAPVLLTLDSFPSYLDLGTTPDDMLSWLAVWSGLISPERDLVVNGDPERLRGLLGIAQELHVQRGTRLGIERAITAELDLRCVVHETGDTTWSDQPDEPLPNGELADEGTPAIEVLVYPRSGQRVDQARLELVLDAATPVHVRRRARIVRPPEDAVPEVITPDEIEPEVLTPDDIAPDDILPEDVAPDDAAPEDVALEDVTWEDVTSDEIEPDDVLPEDVAPDDGARPDHVRLEDITWEGITQEDPDQP